MPDFSLPLDPAAVARYASGRATSAERVEIETRMAADPATTHEVERLRAAFTPPTIAIDVDADWRHVSDRMYGARSLPPTASVTRRPRLDPARPPMTHWRAMVAGVTLAAAAAVAVYAWRRPPTGEAMWTYATTNGQQSVVRLGDGSRVTLAPNSSLRVPTGFGRETRTVALTGQAYFDVASKAGAPFVVSTGVIQTRVLGTRFEVRHYADDRDVRVAVVSGKVITTASTVQRPSMTLVAGRMGRMTDSTAIVMLDSAVRESVDWAGNRLVFNDAPVAEALGTIGHWYGYQFRFADSALARDHLSAEFEHKSAEAVLTALKATLGVTMTFDGTIITLHSKRRASAPAEPRRIPRELTIPKTEVGR